MVADRRRDAALRARRALPDVRARTGCGRGAAGVNPGPPVLAILTHPRDDFWDRRYLIQLLIPRWEAMGFRVAVVADEATYVPGDAALLHVDLSVVPDSVRRMAERYPVVVNGSVVDIRKRSFSRQILDRNATWAGEVIVKSNWNYGGAREFRLDVLESPLGRLLTRRYQDQAVCNALGLLERRKPWRWRRMLPTSQYRVYPDRTQVPSGVWGNPNLIVERFVAERAGSDYCCRHWLFFGNREVTRRVTSPLPVVKAAAKIETTSDAVPAELRAIRAQMGFDFGKFDYGIVDGTVFLYDVNRTPGISPDPRTHGETREVLSQGLRDVVSEAGRTADIMTSGAQPEG